MRYLLTGITAIKDDMAQLTSMCEYVITHFSENSDFFESKMREIILPYTTENYLSNLKNALAI
jgi:hypothetical protein